MEERPWLKHYDSGVPQHIDFPKVTLFHLLEETTRKYPNQPCTIFKGKVLTYAEVNALSDRLAAALAAMGVKRGDPVAIFMPNTPQFVIAFFGILKAGGAVVAMNPLYTPREIEHQMKDAGCEIMLVTSNFYAKTKEVQARTRLKTLIVTNIKEYLPPLLRTLFTVAKEKKEGHRVTLGAGDRSLLIIVPAYNEQDAIGSVVGEIGEAVPSAPVLVIDDCSLDGT
ncbi:MAG: AMP-binding protein, partial [Chloroflexi bacterium]|nr:AMP-binding protein [Chloroflexota bacterium]